MSRAWIAFLALAMLLIAGCDGRVNVVGTWNGEIVPGTGNAIPPEMRPNMVLTFNQDGSYKATLLTAEMSGKWTLEDNSTVVLKPERTTVNGQDFAQFKESVKPMLAMAPATLRAQLDAFEPTREWRLQVQKEGSVLYLPAPVEQAPAFTFKRSS